MDALLGGTVEGRYTFRNFIGKGAFSVVFRGMDEVKNKPVAIKVENSALANGSKLNHEAGLMLNHLHHIKGIPHLKYHGSHCGSQVAVMTLTGQNLEDLLSLCGGQFTLQTVLSIARQLVTRLRDIHAKGVLHRDIKPDNIAIGSGKRSNRMYLIDFGLSELETVSGKKQPRFIGSIAFSSVAAFEGVKLSYRDDLESLSYLLIYLLKGFLPWTKTENLNMTDIQLSSHTLKRKLPHRILCRELPSVFERILTYSKELKSGEMPNYREIKTWLRDTAHQYKLTLKPRFDWTIRTYQKCDITLGVGTMTAKRKLKSENSSAKLFLSAAMEVPEDSLEAIPLAHMLHIEPHLLPVRTGNSGEDTSATQRSLEQCEESEEFEDGKIPVYSPYNKVFGKERKTLESEKKPSVTKDLRAYLKSVKS